MVTKREEHLAKCSAFGWDDSGGSGFDDTTEECRACLASDSEMHAACKAEADAGRATAVTAKSAEASPYPEPVSLGTARKPEVEAWRQKVATMIDGAKQPKISAATPSDQLPANQLPTASKKKPRPIVKEVATPTTLNDWQRRFHVRPGSQPCVVFDKIYAGGKTADQIGQELAIEQPKKFTAKTGMAFVRQELRYWTKKRGYKGIMQNTETGALSIGG